jgi:hypothetical protein
MARILFVTGSAGGVGVGNLQHRGCPAEIEWWFPDCAQLIADEVCNDDPAERRLAQRPSCEQA